MTFGLSVPAFTELHVVISLVGIIAGILFFATLIGGRWLSLMCAVFLGFTILTSVTGFFFPPKPIGPPFIFGVVSLALLAGSLLALYGKRLTGGWRVLFLVTALLAQWLNMVVLVVQSYQKVPALHALAPTGTEPVFLATQGLVLVAILFTGWRTLRRPV
ncbi:MAG: hypothetical protein V4475_22885 [Pseudomonadota bacterium]